MLNKKDKYALGDTVEYKVTVTNIGNQAISGIKLTDKVNNTTTITTANRVNAEGTIIEENVVLHLN